MSSEANGRNPGWLLWRMSVHYSEANRIAREARLLVAAARVRGDPRVSEARAMLDELEVLRSETEDTWERVKLLVTGEDPALVEDHKGISVIRNHGTDPRLTEQMSSVWSEGSRVHDARALFLELQKALEQQQR